MDSNIKMKFILQFVIFIAVTNFPAGQDDYLLLSIPCFAGNT